MLAPDSSFRILLRIGPAGAVPQLHIQLIILASALRMRNINMTEKLHKNTPVSEQIFCQMTAFCAARLQAFQAVMAVTDDRRVPELRAV